MYVAAWRIDIKLKKKKGTLQELIAPVLLG